MSGLPQCWKDTFHSLVLGHKLFCHLSGIYHHTALCTMKIEKLNVCNYRIDEFTLSIFSSKEEWFCYLACMMHFCGSKFQMIYRILSRILLNCIHNHTWMMLQYPLDIVLLLPPCCNLLYRFPGLDYHTRLAEQKMVNIMYRNIEISINEFNWVHLY